MNKYFLTPLRQRVTTLPIVRSRINDWMKDWRFFFILGVGRSGTAFLSSFLNNAPGAYVFHEPVIEDFLAEVPGHYIPNFSNRYMKNFRVKEIYVRMRGVSAGVYGEVNGTLRCHANAIKATFPGVTLIHLIRDGRDVVRSHMSRRTMTLRNPLSMSIRPVNGDIWKDHWREMDRFARICWYWQEENRRLRTTIGNTVQFEGIISNYEYFFNEILKPCGIQIEKAVWEAAVNKPRNITNRFSMPEWSEWTSKQKDLFREICGAEMKKSGYDL